MEFFRLCRISKNRNNNINDVLSYGPRLNVFSVTFCVLGQQQAATSQRSKTSLQHFLLLILDHFFFLLPPNFSVSVSGWECCREVNFHACQTGSNECSESFFVRIQTMMHQRWFFLPVRITYKDNDYAVYLGQMSPFMRNGRPPLVAVTAADSYESTKYLSLVEDTLARSENYFNAVKLSVAHRFSHNFN